MSASVPCRCEPQDRKKWRVRDRNCNYSRFNGNRRTPSDYSAVTCIICGGWWRTKAAYVATLRDLDPLTNPERGER